MSMNAGTESLEMLPLDRE